MEDIEKKYGITGRPTPLVRGWTVFANQALANAPMHDVTRKGGTVCAHFVAIKEEMVPLKGLEPPTPSLRMTCSTS